MSWRPTASHDVIRARAQMLAQIRDFFAERGVLEVETPVLSRAGVTDPNIESFRTQFTGPGFAPGTEFYLQPSPEFPMKRLLCDGIGPIYQICKVFRGGESGRLHNPEFTMLEWYCPGYDCHDLMNELEALVVMVLDGHVGLKPSIRMTYQSVFEKYLQVDPHTATGSNLAALAREHGIDLANEPEEGAASCDFWLDLLMTHVVEPSLEKDRCVFIYDYPASQASLAKVEEQADGRLVARRFELYLQGVELANGYDELTDHVEQEKRLHHDNSFRKNHMREPLSLDRNLLQALEHGMPDSSGVAVGLDRLLMLAVGAESLYKILSFPFEKA